MAARSVGGGFIAWPFDIIISHKLSYSTKNLSSSREIFHNRDSICFSSHDYYHQSSMALDEGIWSSYSEMKRRPPSANMSTALATDSFVLHSFQRFCAPTQFQSVVQVLMTDLTLAVHYSETHMSRALPLMQYLASKNVSGRILETDIMKHIMEAPAQTEVILASSKGLLWGRYSQFFKTLINLLAKQPSNATITVIADEIRITDRAKGQLEMGRNGVIKMKDQLIRSPYRSFCRKIYQNIFWNDS